VSLVFNVRANNANTLTFVKSLEQAPKSTEYATFALTFQSDIPADAKRFLGPAFMKRFHNS